MLLVDALEIVLRIQRLIFVNFRGILRYQRNGWSSWIIHERISPSWQEVGLWFVLPIFRRTVENVQVHWNNHWVWSQSIVWSLDPSPHWKRQISRVLVILSWATFHMLSTDKMASITLPTCDDVGSKSQRFSDFFVCDAHSTINKK